MHGSRCTCSQHTGSALAANALAANALTADALAADSRRTGRQHTHRQTTHWCLSIHSFPCALSEPNPAQPPPLTCANDHASTEESLAIVVSTLSNKLFLLYRSYNVLSQEFTCTQNLLEAVMVAYCLQSTNESWRVERQLQHLMNV
jgi:hypothetical protein